MSDSHPGSQGLHIRIYCLLFGPEAHIFPKGPDSETVGSVGHKSSAPEDLSGHGHVPTKCYLQKQVVRHFGLWAVVSRPRFWSNAVFGAGSVPHYSHAGA